MKKCVSIIGRPNVGKSTIFNWLIKEKKSIVGDMPGITRDRIFGDVRYEDKEFFLIDTGGIDTAEEDFNQDIKIQAMLAIDESDVIIFVVDGTTPLTSNDYYIRDILMKSGKKVVVAVNKIDTPALESNIYNYYELGFENVVGLSAAHRLGMDELLTQVTKDFNLSIEEDDEKLKFCIIGRPNVGKSSLVNAILNEDRSIVSDVEGTTRDATDTAFKYKNEEYIIIDTAGLKKRGKIYENIEKYSLLRTKRAIQRSDVCVILLSAEDGITAQDKHIVSYALEEYKGIILAVNKWDMITNPNQEIKLWKQKIKNEFQFIDYAPIVFLSAKTKKRVQTLMPEVIKTYQNTMKTLQTSTLNNVISDAVVLHQPPTYKNKRLKIYFVSQTGTKPIKITFNVNNKSLVHFSYERYLINTIRNNFDLSGAPIVIQFKNKNE